MTCFRTHVQSALNGFWRNWPHSFHQFLPSRSILPRPFLQPFSKSSLVSFERPNFGVESRLSPFHCQLFLQLGNFEFNFVPSKNSYYFLAPSSDLDKTKTKRDKEMDTPMIAWFLSVVIRGDEISRSISLEEGAPINKIREKEKE